MQEEIMQSLGSHLVQTHVTESDLWIRVADESWLDAVRICKEDLGFDYFSFLSAVDWLPNPNLDGEYVFDEGKEPAGPQEIIVDPEVRYAGGTSRFQVLTRLYSVEKHHGVTLVTDVPESLTLASIVTLYKGADWHERETWEMFGITFEGHSDLRHIYLPAEFEGFPLRKDFPLLARVVRPWPGLVDMEEMPIVENQEKPEQDFA